MRQILIQTPRGHGRSVLQAAKEHDGTNLALIEAQDENSPHDLVLVHVSNQKVEGLLDALQGKPDLRITLNPHGVIALYPPTDQAPEQVTDVGHRSPIEIFLDGLQSVGSWQGLTGYAAAAGAIVWIGLYTNTVFLLTAAMLIAPFAGPAMNAAIATARGDTTLLRRAVTRYFASLALSIAVAWALSMAFGQQVATEQMVDASMISTAAVLLPLTAGAAGALHLCLAERNSLVSGAAVGMLVAASLAPPAGVIGMAAAITEWEMVRSGLFLLLLQLAGINLTGTLVFRYFGLSPSGPRYERGKRWFSWVVWPTTALALAALLLWQFWSSPQFQRSTITQRAAAQIHESLDGMGDVELVESEVRFTRADVPGQNTLLVTVYLQSPDAAEEIDPLRRRVSDAVKQRLRERFDVTPLVQVVVLEE